MWFMEEIPEGLGRAWRRVLSLMPIGKLGFSRFLNSLLICVISFSEIRIFVVGGLWLVFFFFCVCVCGREWMRFFFFGCGSKRSNGS